MPLLPRELDQGISRRCLADSGRTTAGRLYLVNNTGAGRDARGCGGCHHSSGTGLYQRALATQRTRRRAGRAGYRWSSWRCWPDRRCAAGGDPLSHRWLKPGRQQGANPSRSVGSSKRQPFAARKSGGVDWLCSVLRPAPGARFRLTSSIRLRHESRSGRCAGTCCRGRAACQKSATELVQRIGIVSCGYTHLGLRLARTAWRGGVHLSLPSDLGPPQRRQATATDQLRYQTDEHRLKPGLFQTAHFAKA